MNPQFMTWSATEMFKEQIKREIKKEIADDIKRACEATKDRVLTEVKEIIRQTFEEAKLTKTELYIELFEKISDKLSKTDWSKSDCWILEEIN